MTRRAAGMTKKELLVLQREKDKLERTLGGIRDMSRVPSAVWIVDTKKEHIAVGEARKLGIPVVAILDTNCDPDEVDYPIPGNDDAIRSVTLLTRVLADAVADGLMARAGAGSGDDKPAGAELGADEPLADWERELLARDTDTAAATADELAVAGGVSPAEAPADGAVDVSSEADSAGRRQPADTPPRIRRQPKPRLRTPRQPTPRQPTPRQPTQPTASADTASADTASADTAQPTPRRRTGRQPTRLPPTPTRQPTQRCRSRSAISCLRPRSRRRSRLSRRARPGTAPSTSTSRRLTGPSVVAGMAGMRTPAVALILTGSDPRRAQIPPTNI